MKGYPHKIRNDDTLPNQLLFVTKGKTWLHSFINKTAIGNASGKKVEKDPFRQQESKNLMMVDECRDDNSCKREPQSTFSE